MSTLEQLKRFCPESVAFASGLESAIAYADLSKKPRFAMFMAQCAHESAGFKVLQENLNYSESGLLSVFPSRFNAITAREYARKPERIANKVYASRLGNGDEASGDGWKYRGRGLIQLTGRMNYLKCSRDLYHDDRLLTTPQMLTNPDEAAKSAGWFWRENKLNQFCDANYFLGLTKAINGETNGLADRQAWLQKAQPIW